jgi:hypothetical protein
MRHKNRWMVLVLIIAGLLLGGCTSKSATSRKIEPAEVEPLEGGLNRVVLTEKAAERLDIQTAPVREEQVVRKRKVGGQVVALLEAEVADLAGVLVRVPLNESDLNKVDGGQPALVLPLTRDEGTAGLTAQPVEAPAVGDSDEGTEALYYVVDSAEHGLVPGQIVLVELSLAGSGGQRKVIPYGAVIYDLHGETWVYTNPEPLVFVRHAILVDYIEGDVAVLLEGPPAGTEVATVGVAELFGTEFGVGK